jgi:hypothetical protein
MQIFNHFNLIVVTYACCLFGMVKAQKPLIWDTDILHSLNISDSLRNYTLLKAKHYATQSCPLITDKNKSYSGDRHNYESLSTYFWPLETNPKAPWVYKDGEKNPERLKYDGAKINTFTYRCKYFAQAYLITADTLYAKLYLNDIKAWFSDRRTRMNPHLEYAQIIPNTQENMGRPHGIIDAYVLIDVVESLIVMQQQEVIDARTQKKIKKWFSKFASWLRKSDNGIKQRLYNTNLSLAYDVMMCEIYLYIEDFKHYQNIADNFRTVRLETQFLTDGSQPQEMKRAQPISYCIYNMEHVLDFCLMQQSMGRNFYAENASLIDSAMNFISGKIYGVDQLNDMEKSNIEMLKNQYNSLAKTIQRLNFKNLE